MTNRVLLDQLYEFIDSAFWDHDGSKPTPGAGPQMVVSRRELRVYARSFVGKQLASEDYSAVLDAIRGRW